MLSDKVLKVEGGIALPGGLPAGALDGAISSKWGFSENNRKAKYYAITRKGRQGAGKSRERPGLAYRPPSSESWPNSGTRVRRLLLKLARRRTLQRDIEAELAFHREMAEAGGNPLPLGNIPLIQEASAEQWRFMLLEDFWRDTVHGARALLRTPTLTFVAILSLALGMGAATAIFSVVNAVILKPLPLPDPDRLMVVVNTGMGPRGERFFGTAASPARFALWRTRSDVLQDVSAFMRRDMNFSYGSTVELVSALQTSKDFLHCMGTPILQGRTFTQEEDSPGGARVTLLSEGFWSKRLMRDPAILGKTISLSGDPYKVIGIMARNPGLDEFGPTPDVIVPLQLDPASKDQGSFFTVVARLKPQVSLEQAKATLQATPSAFPQLGSSVIPYREAMSLGNTRSTLWVLFAAVGFVLLIACANVANLLLVRAVGRGHEIAIRMAIGSGRGRMIRQLLTESLFLSFVGGGLGVLLGYFGIHALLAVNTANLPRVGVNGSAVAIDWRVAVFALGLTLLTGIIFGLFPALSALRQGAGSMFSDLSGRAKRGRRGKARSALVVAEVALAAVLLVGAGLLIRTFVALYAVNPGFETSHVLTFGMLMSGAKYSESSGIRDTVQSVLPRLRAIPGIAAASAACCTPMGAGFTLPFEIESKPNTFGRRSAGGWISVSPGYFDVLRIPLTRGRVFEETDDASSTPVALINETAARLFWNGTDPIHDRVTIGHGSTREFLDEPPRRIVGIVADVHDVSLNGPPRPNVYVPQAQIPDSIQARTLQMFPMIWMVRTESDLGASAAAIEAELRGATGLPISAMRSMEDLVSLSTGRQRFNMLLMTVFGGIALLLSASGVYGLIAYTVARRTHEFGIRLALGAENAEIRNTIVRYGMLLTLLGLSIGLVTAWALANSIESLLFGVAPRDFAVFLAVPLVLIPAALLAVWLPALRIRRIDPIETLRYE